MGKVAETRGGGGLKSVPPLGSLCPQPPGPGPLHRGVTQDTRRGPNAWVREDLTGTEVGTKCEVGTAIITGAGEGPPPPTNAGRCHSAQGKCRYISPPLQPQEIQNKTRLAWAKAHGHGSSTSVYTAGSTANSVRSETLYMVGSVCSTI